MSASSPLVSNEPNDAAPESRSANRRLTLALVGKILLKTVLAAVGLIIGSILGLLAALHFGLIDFAC